MTIRKEWTARLEKLCRPILENLAAGTLIANMPVQHYPVMGYDRSCTYLEALGRSLSGLAPWLENDALEGAEKDRRDALLELTLAALEKAGSPDSPDAIYLRKDSDQVFRQGLVDSSYLSLAFLRAPNALWGRLSAGTQNRIIDVMRGFREVPCPFNNWLLFAAMNECFLCFAGVADWDYMRIDYAFRAHELRYKGDGIYGDGPSLHLDYYNSYVIHPYLLEILESLKQTAPQMIDWVNSWYEPMKKRFIRYAQIQERLIAPDGSYPAIGRSLVYRCGAFQALAMASLRQWLPEDLSPGQVRNALNLVIRKTLDAPGTFDDKGWLRIGMSGDQPSLGEIYISTGSLYMASLAFLPLGLPEKTPFWQVPESPTTSQKIWSGEDVPSQHALDDYAETVGNTPR